MDTTDDPYYEKKKTVLNWVFWILVLFFIGWMFRSWWNGKL